MTLEGNPWFVVEDACRVLETYIRGDGRVNTSQATKMLNAEETKSLATSEANRIGLKTTGPFGRSVISESGLYKLIMRSDKPQAKPFQDWVTQEVLPSIRKTGSYVTGQPSLKENPQMDPLDLMMAHVFLPAI